MTHDEILALDFATVPNGVGVVAVNMASAIYEPVVFGTNRFTPLIAAAPSLYRVVAANVGAFDGLLEILENAGIDHLTPSLLQLQASGNLMLKLAREGAHNIQVTK